MSFNRLRSSAAGALVLGALLLFVGGYYFLRNDLGLDLGELDSDLVWPIVAVVLGALLLARGLRSPQHPA